VVQGPLVTASLLNRRFIVIAGKGGVGRTTAAAALALSAARAGKKVLLCQTKAKERLSTLFGVGAIGAEVTRVRERLWAVNMNPQAALREYGTMVLRSEFIAKQVLENRVSRAFLHAVPGVEDYAMLGKAWFHTTEEEGGRPKYDLVLLDGPATGHVLTLLGIPDAILAAVPDGPLSRPARATYELLRDRERTSFLIVTLAEDMPVNEAIELARRAQAMKLPLGPLVVNRLFPPRFRQGGAARGLALLLGSDDGRALREGARADATLAALVDSARLSERRRALNDRELERLRRELPLPQVLLPYLFRLDFGPDALSDLADRLDGQLRNLEEPGYPIAIGSA
jgi:anion-transporting  ArsA/GET3 family ATPase